MIRLAQLLLLLSAAALWGASRMAWVDVQSFDGLGQPKTTALTGGVVVDGAGTAGGDPAGRGRRSDSGARLAVGTAGSDRRRR